MPGSRLYDFYDPVDDFCIRLRAVERDAWADRLTDAKAAGATSGEVLSGTGSTLRVFVEEESDPILRTEASRLLRECEALWRS